MDPSTGKVAAAPDSDPGADAEAKAEGEAAALGPRSPAKGDGAGATPAAMTALIEATATMTAQETFFMSMAVVQKKRRSEENRGGESGFIGDACGYF
ncbi:hypothetical protein GQ457_06G025030 [Hibiscus cannabinus]